MSRSLRYDLSRKRRLSKFTTGYDFLCLSTESVQVPRLSVDSLNILILLCVLIVYRRRHNSIGDWGIRHTNIVVIVASLRTDDIYNVSIEIHNIFQEGVMSTERVLSQGAFLGHTSSQ